MKRIAAILCLGGVLALGAGSQAAASGDPVSIWECSKAGCFPDASSQQLTGTQLGDLVCTPSSEVGIPVPLYIPFIIIPLPPGPTSPPNYTVYVCKQ
jgi:hypothetical protein